LTQPGRTALQITASRNKPWLKSTGPKTFLGKKIASQNRTLHGLYTRAFTQERRDFEKTLKDLSRMNIRRGPNRDPFPNFPIAEFGGMA
jgi:hypothetical protein